ncbi:cation diffusion facilitator family transporter [Salibacterium qingdaonense]|uniref:Cobalt-zinc-cadmium efflux system protein n=1 Tax=Salibacterium qingdaonense TaxID=266892 RepID=A0A1I4QJV8_9BACI|nr:cation diffusion facilitator family transporter [Salibacterium qingdaonense]SFM39903.1 cobalt-zinc-cadmium efflux system protein [Salibacterium qingdaonense]
MGHDHHHDHHHHSHSNIKTAFFLNFGFTIIELIGGVLTNSMAIISDAIHDLGDSLSLGTAWFLQNKSEQKSNQTFTFGYRRFSLLGALINSLVLVAGSLFILSEAVPRLWNPEPAHAGGMLLLSLLGMAVNGAAVLRMKSGASMNEKVVSWHLLEDVLGWAAVFVVSVIMMFWDAAILDPLLSVLITLYILMNVLKNLKKTLFLFLDGVPEEMDTEQIEQSIRSIPDVEDTHHTHIWSLDGEQHVLSTHVVLNEDISKADMMKVKASIKEALEAYPLEHITIETECTTDDCSLTTLHH